MGTKLVKTKKHPLTKCSIFNKIIMLKVDIPSKTKPYNHTIYIKCMYKNPHGMTWICILMVSNT